MSSHLIRKIWAKTISLNSRLGMALIVVVGIIRFYFVMQANTTGDYQMVSVVFSSMVLLPLIILNGQGLLRIGLAKPMRKLWILYSAIIGIIFCLIVYFIGVQLFGDDISNWFVYISKSYSIDKSVLGGSDLMIYFLIYATMSMIFSPVGEELFYRGLIHLCFQEKFGSNRASQIDSAAFALTHLAHFGIIYHLGTWHFMLVPAIIWVLLMFMVSRLFFICKLQSGSLLGPIVCHAAFNVTMVYVIFYHIL